MGPRWLVFIILLLSLDKRNFGKAISRTTLNISGKRQWHKIVLVSEADAIRSSETSRAGWREQSLLSLSRPHASCARNALRLSYLQQTCQLFWPRTARSAATNLIGDFIAITKIFGDVRLLKIMAGCSRLW